MPHLVSINNLCNYKSSAEALQFHRSGIDMGWGSKPVRFCQKHVYNFLSSLSLLTPPSLAAPWHQKPTKVHQSVMGSKFPCCQKIILAHLFFILWRSEPNATVTKLFVERLYLPPHNSAQKL